jgi:hypothetical protein
MNARHAAAAAALLIGACLATSSLHAQDVVVGGRKKAGPRYEIKLPKKDAKSDKALEGSEAALIPSAETTTGEAPSEPEVDPKLADAIASKITVCYKEETKKELAEDDKALLEEYKVALVRELASGYRSTGCRKDQPTDEQCLGKLDLMTCEEFAKGIKAKRWDRHLLPEDRAALAAYTGGIVSRKWECRAARGMESDPVEQGVEADKLGVLAAMNMTVGKCVLDMTGEADCKALLAAMPCNQVEHAAQRNRLVFLCPRFLRCKNGPSVE